MQHSDTGKCLKTVFPLKPKAQIQTEFQPNLSPLANDLGK